MGYKQNEEEDGYFKRMCAILALYCAIMQTVPLLPSKHEKVWIRCIFTYLLKF
jgi:hypothetical protein